MIWWILLAVLVAVAVYSWRWDWEDLAIALTTTSLIFGIVLLIVTLGVTAFTISCHTRLIQYDELEPILVARRDEISAIVTERCKNYPLEAGVLSNFNPAILLKLPEIKSDTFILAQLAIYQECIDRIYTLQEERTERREDLRFYQYRWFVPTLANPNF